jgi:ribonuclease Z
MATTKTTVGRFTLLGHSIGGVETCLVVPELKLVFDIGFCPEEALTYPTVLVSHGHPDHLAGAVAHAAGRAIRNLTPSTFVVPKPLVEPLTQMFRVWDSFQPTPCFANVTVTDAMPTGNKNLVVEAFETDHHPGMPSQGYVVFERKNKLRPEFQHLSGAELANLRKQNVTLHETSRTPVFAYTGDTKPSTFNNVPVLQNVEVLVTEASFVEGPTSLAHNRGHMHVNDVKNLLHRLQNKHMVLTHFSPRFSRAQVEEATKNLPRTTPL